MKKDHATGKHSRQAAQPNRRASSDNQKHERAMREDDDRRSARNVGGQGMGQGRGMNPGEVHHARNDDAGR